MSSPIRLAIAGVGNCASSLIQGITYYRDARPEDVVPGLMHVDLGGYHVRDIEFSAAFDDATYWFKSAEHRALFVADPDHYAPQFAGYCAINVSRGVKQEADPEAWAIADGKLYVFSAKQGGPIFQQQTAAIVDRATGNWPTLRSNP